MIEPVPEDRGDDAGGTVCWGCDHTPSSGVFLCDRKWDDSGWIRNSVMKGITLWYLYTTYDLSSLAGRRLTTTLVPSHLIDSHGVGEQPVDDGRVRRARGGRGAVPLRQQRPVDAPRPAGHLEAPGEDAFAGEPALYAAVHRRPDPIEAGVELGGGAVD